MVRNFRSHGSQLTAIAVRPLANFYPWDGPGINPTFINAHPPVGEVPPPVPMDVQLPPYEPMDVKPYVQPPPPVPTATPMQPTLAPGPPPPAQDDDDAKSDFDPLFDDEPDVEGDEQITNGPSNGTANDGGISYPAQMQMSAQSAPSVAIAPKNAPPVLDNATYSSYSPDVLMVASIDGQIVLWDKRVFTPGTGVGRLPLDGRTPPWCVSVSTLNEHRNP